MSGNPFTIKGPSDCDPGFTLTLQRSRAARAVNIVKRGPGRGGIGFRYARSCHCSWEGSFLLFLLYLSRLNALILIETSDESEAESAAWTGGGDVTGRKRKIQTGT